MPSVGLGYRSFVGNDHEMSASAAVGARWVGRGEAVGPAPVRLRSRICPTSLKQLELWLLGDGHVVPPETACVGRRPRPVLRTSPSGRKITISGIVDFCVLLV